MTWQMAYSLGMNFAWVLEFVELTIGDKQDRESTPNWLQYKFLMGFMAMQSCLNVQLMMPSYLLESSIWLLLWWEEMDESWWLVEKRLGGWMILGYWWEARIIINNVMMNVHHWKYSETWWKWTIYLSVWDKRLHWFIQSILCGRPTWVVLYKCCSVWKQ
jgi:hypothetical protein